MIPRSGGKGQKVNSHWADEVFAEHGQRVLGLEGDCRILRAAEGPRGSALRQRATLFGQGSCLKSPHNFPM